MAELVFTHEDLEANREGHLTEAQRARLRFALLRDGILYGLLALLPLGGLVVVISESAEQPVNGLLLAIFAILLGLLLITLLQYSFGVRYYRNTTIIRKNILFQTTMSVVQVYGVCG